MRTIILRNAVVEIDSNALVAHTEFGLFSLHKFDRIFSLDGALNGVDLPVDLDSPDVSPRVALELLLQTVVSALDPMWLNGGAVKVSVVGPPGAGKSTFRAPSPWASAVERPDHFSREA